MATKKEPTGKEKEIAAKKNHPVSNSSQVEVAQNGEANPPRRKSR